MTKTLAVTACLLILSALNTHAAKRAKAAMSLPEAIEFVRPSVVQVVVLVQPPPRTVPGLPTPMKQMPEPHALGSGFLVSPSGYAITADHVVRALQTYSAQGAKLVVFLAYPNFEGFKNPQGGLAHLRFNYWWAEVNVVDEDPVHDIALLKLGVNPFKTTHTMNSPDNKTIELPHRAATLSAPRPRDGEAIAVSGYPLLQNVLITNSGIIASSWEYGRGISNTLGNGPDLPDARSLADFYLAGMQVNPGNSGGPVYDSQSGSVIGICEAYEDSPLFTSKQHSVPVAPGEILTQNAGLAVVIPIKYAIDLLTKNGVSDLTTAASQR